MNKNHKPKANMIQTGLYDAVAQCTSRGLRMSTQFAAEMLVASVDVHPSTTSSTTTSSSTATSSSYLLAKACFDRGEYLRAAHTLRNLPLVASPRNLEGTATASVSCDRLAYFLRCYSLYLAGEKRREEIQAERGGPSNHWAPGLAQGNSPTNAASSSAPDPSGGANPPSGQASGMLGGGNGNGNDNLSLLHGELTNLYNRNVDHNQEPILDGFLLYLYGVVLRDLGNIKHAKLILCESVIAYPLNWSAWLDLALLCPEKQSLIDIQRILNEKMNQQQKNSNGSNGSSSSSSSVDGESPGGSMRNFIDENWIGQCFMGHALMEQQEHNEAKYYFQNLFLSFPNSAYLNSALAKTHYNAREYDQSKELYEALRSEDPYRLDGMDVYSNILFVKGLRAQLSHLAHSAMKIDKFRPQTCCIVGNYYSLKGQHERAVIYFRRALKLGKCVN